MLGEANMEAAHYDQAETWYKAALAKKPGEVKPACQFGVPVFTEGRMQSG